MSSRSVPDPATPHRAGTAAIVGRPNVGKSTLLNRLVGARLSIISSRPQTTRQRITGIVTRPDAQVLFVDTPGYQTEHDSALNRAMNRTVAASLRDVDAIVWVVEALRYDDRDEVVARLLPEGAPVILAINKSDKVKDKARLLPYIAGLSARRRFEALVPVSAAKGTHVEALLDAIVALMPEGPRMHDEDELTTVNERLLASELLREKLFQQLGEELPYAAAVEIGRFKEERGLRRIEATILVEKEGQKAIVIGARGAKLKSIATQARRDMERLFGGKVFLEVWVKVRRGWAESEGTLRRMGLSE
jgi:GTP-binding protein Era